MKTFHLIITKIDGPVFDGDALSVTLPGEEGEVTILAGHEPLITRLKTGIITVMSDAGKTVHPIESGVLEVANNTVTVLL
jgi:F-type H+-transporting ATPase subunit epsilon